MPRNRTISTLAIILFGVVIILGEAFKLNIGLAKVSLSIPIIFISIFCCLHKNFRLHFLYIDKLVYLFGFIFLVFTGIGLISGNHPGDVFEDLFPILVFVVLFIIWRSFEADDLLRIWKTIIIFSIIAACKVLIISILPFEILWDNNWQATREPLPIDGFYRIILRGGDIFLSFSLVYFILKIHSQKSQASLIRLAPIFLMIIVVFISLSRSSFLAAGVSLIITFLIFKKYFSTRRIFVFSFSVIALVIVFLPFFNAISLAASIFQARKDAFDANDIATEFRKDERSLIFDKAATAMYLGNGLGSYFHLDLSGSDKKDERSIYAHDFNSWMILKTGVIGIICFYLIFFNSCYNIYWCLKQKAHVLHDKYKFLMLGLFSSALVVYIISLLANKLSTLSGCIFMAFFAASSIILKRKYESSY